jgi:hypothetical protein
MLAASSESQTPKTPHSSEKPPRYAIGRSS